VLSEEGVKKRLQSGEVTISYAFDPRATPPIRLEPSEKVDASDPGARATQIFDGNFFGDRLSLTLGPLLLSHNFGWHKGRKRYKGRPGIFDLRRTGNSVEIQSGESVTVNANEHIRLGGSTGALTLPRLTHSTAGLVLAGSYVDPYWDGIAVLQLVNNSPRPFTLTFGEKFATTFFFPLSGGALPPSFRDRFVSKSHHYGLSWDRILSSDADPFPLRKQPVPGVLGRSDWTAKELLTRVGKPLGAVGLSVGVAAGALIYVGRVQDRIERVDTVEDAQRDQQKTISDLERSVEVLKAGTVASGSTVVQVPANDVTGTALVDLGGLTANRAHTAFVTLAGVYPGVVATGELRLGPSGGSQLRIVVRLPTDAGPSGATIAVAWLVT